MTHPREEKCLFCIPFLNSLKSRIIARNDTSYCIYDAYPISRGHALVIPERHIQSLFDITQSEREALLELLDTSKSITDQQFEPDGYNIGINDGVAAGQTVPHLHLHLIPRYSGDVEKPEGGIRWILPEKAVYWE